MRLEVFLPWLLAMLPETLHPLIRKKGTLSLEKIKDLIKQSAATTTRKITPFRSESRDHGDIDAIALGDRSQRLTGSSPLDSFLALIFG